MSNLLSYKNDTKLKKKFVAQIEKHRKADQIEQGTYGRQNGEWKGCAVSCSLRSMAIINGEPLTEKYNNHKDYETKLGMPEWLARLEDTIFEGLTVKESKTWPEKFAKAIPVGVNLEPVKWHFCAYLMKENIERVLKLKIADDLKKQVVDAIRSVLSLHKNAIQTGVWNESAAESAARSAESAAESARSAESAAWSAESARSAAESAESAARSAWSARSAARSARSAAESARSAAESAESAWSAAAFLKHSKYLLKLLKNAK